MTMVTEQNRGDEVPERWSAKAKSEVVLRLFRGEAIGSTGGITNVSLARKQVEEAPDWVVRSGISATRQGLSLTLQHSVVSRTFADALNSPMSKNGSTGPVPGYSLVDLSVGFGLGQFGLRAGINNLGARYFTRRTSQYPGPGIIPSDGRTVFITLTGRAP